MLTDDGEEDGGGLCDDDECLGGVLTFLAACACACCCDCDCDCECDDE
jgi:hypothetical protein